MEHTADEHHTWQSLAPPLSRGCNYERPGRRIVLDLWQQCLHLLCHLPRTAALGHTLGPPRFRRAQSQLAALDFPARRSAVQASKPADDMTAGLHLQGEVLASRVTLAAMAANPSCERRCRAIAIWAAVLPGAHTISSGVVLWPQLEAAVKSVTCASPRSSAGC